MPYKSREDEAAYMKARYARLKKAGLCVTCGAPSAGGTLCDEHRKHQLELQTKRAKTRMEGKICVYCGKKPSVTSMHCDQCRKKVNSFRTVYRERQVEAVLDRYGRVCICCGEAEPMFLTLDHKDGKGNEHRRLEHSDMYGVLARIFRKSGTWPENFQILCYNCNSGRWRNGGQCPHVTGRKI